MSVSAQNFSNRMVQPFDLPVELCELIFNYLSTNDLIQLTLVSKAFEQFIGRNCMRNIFLKVNCNNAIRDILNSKRSYKKVKLSKLHQNVLEILNFLSPSLIELEIEECGVVVGCDGKIKLNKLKELSLSCCETTILNCFMKEIPKLKILNLYQLHGESRLIGDFLNQNCSIEELNFYLDDSSLDVFEDDKLSKVLNLSLKSIFISNNSKNELHSSTLINIEKLLIAQGEHLQIISLINSANLMLLPRIWNSLKALKQLFFFTSDPFFDYSMDTVTTRLAPNPQLIEFELHSLTPFPLQLTDIKMFLEAAPNLELLSLWHLRRDIVEFAEVYLKKLKLVSYITIDDDYRIFLKSKNGINDQVLRFRQCLI